VHACSTLQEARSLRDKLPLEHAGSFIVDAGAVRTRDGDTVGSIMAKVPPEVWTALGGEVPPEVWTALGVPAGVVTPNSWDTE
jgi:hypothetical protein